MNTAPLENPIIGELLADPVAFKRYGRAYQLLDEYFGGLAVDTLRPLLRHENILVKHAAVWIASELGSQACSMLNDISLLVDSNDRFLTYHVLEIIAVCATGKRVDRFIEIPRALESQDGIIRALAMRLLARADAEQLKAAASLVVRLESNRTSHRCGLLLLADCESRDSEEIRRFLYADNLIERVYGVVAFKRVRGKFPALLDAALELPDPDVSRFVRETI